MSHGPQPVSIDNVLGTLSFLADRTPSSPDEKFTDAFAELFSYRDGGIYVGHWAGESEWERHNVGDEIVMVLDGSTTMFFLTDAGGEESATMSKGHVVVVPEGTWHRFETPDQVKILSVTPQPTDHRPDKPPVGPSH